MKIAAVILSLAVSGVVLSSPLAPASASKMNGKCCQSSDGGRSAAYIRQMNRRAIPHTCSAYAASCIRDSADRSDRVQMCTAARTECMKTGVHVGPYSGRHYAGMARI
ncbi:hypothetical protein CQ12_17075 [Bradyrhizobium jicamae]|uniref:Uncharacterized protein n=1 Tax=Bradyrhizobium jicamae TaxID=280332 RepID=A0A0R3KWK4_9BRAD|nr:hypothetical protein [Bradyrhizobium jicamae]KRQ99674.1 hypothetical protein CQ12_17075 [Bradyrhizobium jicamae]